VQKIGIEAFRDCHNLASVTFLGGYADISVGLWPSFPGDLGAKYNAWGAGTYTRPAGSNTWTKVDDYWPEPAPTPIPGPRHRREPAVCPTCGQPMPRRR